MILVGRRRDGGDCGFSTGFPFLEGGIEGQGWASFHLMNVRSLDTVYTYGGQTAIEVAVRVSARK